LDKLGDGEPAPAAEADLIRIDEVARRGGGKVEVRRIAEHIQLDPDLMAELKEAGVIPGGTVEVDALAGAKVIQVRGNGATAVLDPSVAHAVMVQAR
jgi:DtxR family Mn-dependent transcriptional regulator